MSSHLLDLHSRPTRTADRPVVFVSAPMVPDGVACVIAVDGTIRYLGAANALPMGELPAGSFIHVSPKLYEIIDRKSKLKQQIGEVA